MSQQDALIQSAQKVGATVAVASTPTSFFESGIQMASLTIGAIGLCVAAFSAYVNYQRFKYMKEQDKKRNEHSKAH